MKQHLPSAARYMRDISDYQIGFEAQRVRRAGSLAVMIKRAEGIGVGGAFNGAQRAVHSHTVGMRVIHYQLLHGAWTGYEQANYLVDLVQRDFHPGDRLLADVENASQFKNGTHANVVLDEWIEQLHHLGHTSPLGYTDRAWVYLADVAYLFANTGWIIADYGTLRRPNPFDGRAINWRAPDGKLRIPLLGRQFTDGQHGAQPHTCPGITGPVDCTWLTNNGVRTILQRDP